MSASSLFDSAESWRGPAWIESGAHWVRSHATQVLVAGIALQMAVLAAMIVIHAMPLAFGERIWLRVRPIDPRDMFRGDFVVLGYDFSRVPASSIQGLPAVPPWRASPYSSDAWQEDRTVYVTLVPDHDGRHYRMDHVSVERPAAGKFIKGRLSRTWFSGADLSVRCGIEAFYVQEGRGKQLEQLRNTNQLSAEIALAPWGQATLCDVK